MAWTRWLALLATLAVIAGCGSGRHSRSWVYRACVYQVAAHHGVGPLEPLQPDVAAAVQLQCGFPPTGYDPRTTW